VSIATTYVPCKNAEWHKFDSNASKVSTVVDLKKLKDHRVIRRINELLGNVDPCGCPLCAPDTGNVQ
jgi:hypothetical protein